MAMTDGLKRLRRTALGRRLWNLRHVGGSLLNVRPGHFYSPVPDPDDVLRYWHDPDHGHATPSLPGIGTDLAAERALWESWAGFRADPGPALAPARRQRFRLQGNRHYAMGDALVYESMLRGTRPRRLIEIGSGFSTALALDTFDAAGLEWPRVTLVEPYPALVTSLLKPGDVERIAIIGQPVQAVGPDLVAGLEPDDILFIDSTHVAKTGSDVLHELFTLLPAVQPGVHVHFHDVFWPFEYPRAWAVDGNYGWNELYFLRAFLTDNPNWRITFFADHFAKLARDEIAPVLAQTGGDLGGGLWLTRR